MSKGLERYFEYLRQDDTDILLGSKISDSEEIFETSHE